MYFVGGFSWADFNMDVLSLGSESDRTVQLHFPAPAYDQVSVPPEAFPLYCISKKLVIFFS